MFSITHFRTEFIQQGQATILRRVTMTQFMFIIIASVVGVGLFSLPLWSAPFLAVIGYLAGYTHNGEILVRRVLAYLSTRLRELTGRPRIVNLQNSWE
ncbi:MAG: hypothetical protein KA314_19300 [Chloroflexi bacterium]|nr:hypothetical protein [Chloroflexota bacterium]MBP8057980.1 hypothetical protein [Chloroflexota bacterium]